MLTKLATLAAKGVKPAPLAPPRRSQPCRPLEEPPRTASSQLGHGAGDVVDHPALGVVGLGAGGHAETAQVDGEGLQPPLAQVDGIGPEATQVGRVLVQEHDTGRAAADQDPVQHDAVGGREAQQGRLDLRGPAAAAWLDQGLQGRGRGGLASGP